MCANKDIDNDRYLLQHIPDHKVLPIIVYCKGRYPWKTGYYDMIDDGNHCVDKRFKLLPAVLKEAKYKTHAIGYTMLNRT